MPFSEFKLKQLRGSGIEMKLKAIIGDYPFKLVKGSLDIDVLDIENDSRKIKKDGLFIAEKGFTVDGHEYIQGAIEKGAGAVVIQDDIDIKEDITVIKVEDSIDALAKFSSRFYKEAWKNMNMIGITGTNGKTSTTYFIKSILEEDNKKSGILGTMGAVIDNKLTNLDNTTPNALVIHSLLSEMIKSKVDSCIMEVSSHALELKRVEYMRFQIGIFTNITKE